MRHVVNEASTSLKYASPRAEAVEVAGAAMCMSIGVSDGVATQKDPTTGTNGGSNTSGSSTSEATGHSGIGMGF